MLAKSAGIRGKDTLNVSLPLRFDEPCYAAKPLLGDFASDLASSYRLPKFTLLDLKGPFNDLLDSLLYRFLELQSSGARVDINETNTSSALLSGVLWLNESVHLYGIS
jgi:hypothetical protein